MSEITGNVTVNIDVEESKAQIMRTLFNTADTRVPESTLRHLMEAYARLEVEEFKDTLLDEYGVRWLSSNRTDWCTVWGFSTFEEAVKYEGLTKFSPDNKRTFLHRYVSEQQEITEQTDPLREENNG